MEILSALAEILSTYRITLHLPGNAFTAIGYQFNGRGNAFTGFGNTFVTQRKPSILAEISSQTPEMLSMLAELLLIINFSK
jgi:hypothetical protein